MDAARDALAHGVSRTVELGGRQLFVEAYPVRPRLVVVGAVEVARTLVRLAKELGYETVVIDGRAAFATRGALPGRGPADRRAGRTRSRTRSGSGPADAVAVLTHDVKFDEPAIVAALAPRLPVRRRGGLAGRRRPTAGRGCSRRAWRPTTLARLRGPIGLDLGGRLPAETALAILAEVVAERRAGGGRPMRELAREREAATAVGTA